MNEWIREMICDCSLKILYHVLWMAKLLWPSLWRVYGWGGVTTCRCCATDSSPSEWQTCDSQHLNSRIKKKTQRADVQPQPAHRFRSEKHQMILSECLCNVQSTKHIFLIYMCNKVQIFINLSTRISLKSFEAILTLKWVLSHLSHLNTVS